MGFFKVIASKNSRNNKKIYTTSTSTDSFYTWFLRILVFCLMADVMLSKKEEGRTIATKAALDEDINVLMHLFKIDPKLLSQKDDNGNTPATLAARYGKIKTLKKLNELVPHTFNQVDDYFMDPLTSALVNGQMQTYAEIMEFKPISLLLHTLAMAATISFAFKMFFAVLQRNQRSQHETSVNVHAGMRDSKTFKAFQTLKEHVGELEVNYYCNVFLSDLGLKRLEMSVKTLKELSSNQESYKDKALYLICFSGNDKFCSQEILLNEIHHEDNQTQITFNIVPQKGHSVETGLNIMSVDNTGKIFDKTKNVPIKIATIYVQNQHVNSSLSNSFKNDPLFRFALGFTTIARDPLFFPQLFKQFSLDPNKPKIWGREVMMYAHAFVNKDQDKNEQSLREAAFVNGIKDGVTISNEDPNKWYRLCEKGQVQYLLITLLQGRLEGVMIDDISMKGLADVIPTTRQLITECTLNARSKKADENQDLFMGFVKNEYIKHNPFLSGDNYPELTQQFLKEINEYALLLDPAEESVLETKKEA